MISQLISWISSRNIPNNSPVPLLLPLLTYLITIDTLLITVIILIVYLKIIISKILSIIPINPYLINLPILTILTHLHPILSISHLSNPCFSSSINPPRNLHHQITTLFLQIRALPPTQIIINKDSLT